ncbi:MAG: HAD-IA family hydrolase [bacterium]|nr:HAD-IA family hydrolase [bacterium]
MIKVILLDAGGVLYLNKRGKGVINRPLLDFIERNQGKYTFGIISTTQYNLEKILEQDKVRQLFSIVLTTGKEKLDKDSPEIFYLALEKLHISVEEVIFIDNSEEYVQVAKKAGIKSILYTTFEQLKNQLITLEINV